MPLTARSLRLLFLNQADPIRLRSVDVLIAGADGEAGQLRLEMEAAAEQRQALLRDAS